MATVGLFLFVSIILTLCLLSLRGRRRFKFLSAFPSPPKLMFIGSSAELLAPNPGKSVISTTKIIFNSIFDFRIDSNGLFPMA